MPLSALESTQIQHKFEQAVWEVSFVLQKCADDPAPGGTKQKEYVARIRQALKNIIAVADEASEKDVTLRWKNNPIFDWQSHLECLEWVPSGLASQCKANFAWFVVNIETSAGKSCARPPGLGPPGLGKPVKLEEDDDGLAIAKDGGHNAKEKNARTPVKPVMTIKKPVIITSIGGTTPPATPLFNAKLHVRNNPKADFYSLRTVVAAHF
ncbi:hypothetical protein HYPSUDRAFT_37681 [Hypholoma sublateritium FD-334 SS-4]|uniref:Uncharacterized protein n=1 Tax=Hypholoma sublateritium (strain FD-334 SS-4) TaxID=945553 RepID=A0A0D2Q287_HYPSF|nr:hypothetical protein HYPSUDRAFT_37681 [Hypholoma sublateritium FD-334 SS-4]